MNICVCSEQRCGMMVEFVLGKWRVSLRVSVAESDFGLLVAVSLAGAEREGSFWWPFDFGDELLIFVLASGFPFFLLFVDCCGSESRRLIGPDCIESSIDALLAPLCRWFSNDDDDRLCR